MVDRGAFTRLICKFCNKPFTQKRGRPKTICYDPECIAKYNAEQNQKKREAQKRFRLAHPESSLKRERYRKAKHENKLCHRCDKHPIAPGNRFLCQQCFEWAGELDEDGIFFV